MCGLRFSAGSLICESELRMRKKAHTCIHCKCNPINLRFRWMGSNDEYCVALHENALLNIFYLFVADFVHNFSSHSGTCNNHFQYIRIWILFTLHVIKYNSNYTRCIPLSNFDTRVVNCVSWGECLIVQQNHKHSNGCKLFQIKMCAMTWLCYERCVRWNRVLLQLLDEKNTSRNAANAFFKDNSYRLVFTNFGWYYISDYARDRHNVNYAIGHR